MPDDENTTGPVDWRSRDEILALMAEGVRKLEADGVADSVVEANRAARDEKARYLRTLSCDWCQGQGGCDGACY